MAFAGLTSAAHEQCGCGWALRSTGLAVWLLLLMGGMVMVLPQVSCTALILLPNHTHTCSPGKRPCLLPSPQLPLAETILEGIARLTKTSRLIRKMARNTGLMDPNVGTQPEILDDLVDGWAAAIHMGGF